MTPALLQLTDLLTRHGLRVDALPDLATWQHFLRSLAATPRAEVLSEAVLDAIDEGVVGCDDGLHVRHVNAAAGRLLGVAPQELVGQRLDELATTDLLGPLATDLLLLLRDHTAPGRRTPVGDVDVRTADGRQVRLEVSVVSTSGGGVRGTLLVLGDTTHRLLAARAMRDSDERLRSIFGAMSAGMVRLDAVGRIEETNAAFGALLGTSAEALVGCFLHDLLEVSERAMAQQLFGELIGGERDRYALEVAFRGSGDTSTWLLLSMSVMRDEAGWPTSAIAVVQDVSDRKRLEAELRQAQKLEAVGRLAAGVAHEINTPIQFIGDNVRFLADAFEGLRAPVAQSDAPDAADALDFYAAEVPLAIEQTLDGVSRVAEIVRAMKALGHPSGGQHGPSDLNKAVTDALTVSRNEVKYVADAELHLADLPPITCAPGEISQVVLNLIVNAAHAIADAVEGTSERGTITITTRLDGDHVVVEVADTGTGIPPTAVDRVFDPFFTTKVVGKGTGQGLALARALVRDNHGGELTFQTCEGLGTTFRIRLPIDGPPRGLASRAQQEPTSR